VHEGTEPLDRGLGMLERKNDGHVGSPKPRLL